MSSDEENIALDVTYHQPQLHQNEEDDQQNPKQNSSKVVKLFDRIMTVMSSPTFIELVVVLIVVVVAILSSELGIHVGKSGKS